MAWDFAAFKATQDQIFHVDELHQPPAIARHNNGLIIGDRFQKKASR